LFVDPKDDTDDGMPSNTMHSAYTTVISVISRVRLQCR